jgi:hypothetical protein
MHYTRSIVPDDARLAFIVRLWQQLPHYDRSFLAPVARGWLTALPPRAPSTLAAS